MTAMIAATDETVAEVHYREENTGEGLRAQVKS
jgi:hypothetical protein